MGQRSIEIGSLLRNLEFSILILGVAYLAHQVYAIGYHDEDDAHILGKRQQKVAEVLALYSGILVVKLLYAVKSVKYSAYRFAVGTCHLIERDITYLDIGYQFDGCDGIALKSDLLCKNLGRLARHALFLFVCESKFFCHKFLKLRHKDKKIIRRICRNEDYF